MNTSLSYIIFWEGGLYSLPRLISNPRTKITKPSHLGLPLVPLWKGASAAGLLLVLETPQGGTVMRKASWGRTTHPKLMQRAKFCAVGGFWGSAPQNWCLCATAGHICGRPGRGWWALCPGFYGLNLVEAMSSLYTASLSAPWHSVEAFRQGTDESMVRGEWYPHLALPPATP